MNDRYADRPTTVRDYVAGKGYDRHEAKQNLQRRFDTASLDLKGMKVAIIGGTAASGAPSVVSWHAAHMLLSGEPFAIWTYQGSNSSKRT